MIGAPEVHARLDDLGHASGLLCGCAASDCPARVPIPALDESSHLLVPDDHRRLFFGLQTASRELRGATEVSAMGGDERDEGRSHCWFPLIDRVLEGDLSPTVGVLGRHDPVPCVKLDQVRVPQRSRTQPLVALAPVAVEAFEQRASSVVEAREDGDQAKHCPSRTAGAGRRRLWRAHVPARRTKSIRLTGVQAKGGKYRHGSRAQCVVVDLLGKFERRTRMALRRPYPRNIGHGRPVAGESSLAVVDASPSASRRRDRAREVCGSELDVAEEDERLGARRAYWRASQEIDGERAGAAQLARRHVARAAAIARR